MGRVNYYVDDPRLIPRDKCATEGTDWSEVAAQLAAHRSELERIHTELRAIAESVADDDDPRARVVLHHVTAVIEDHLELAMMGAGAASRIASSRAAAERCVEVLGAAR